MAGKAAAYCRVSTDMEDQLNSLEAQEEYFRNHTLENGYELVQIYADEGITGTKKKNRKEFLRMLCDAGMRKFDTLFVKDISRFARNTLDSLESVRALKDCGVNIVFVNNRGILESGSELIFTIMSAMAQEESVNTSKRVKFGKAQNAKKGRVPNLVYGYDKVSGEYYTLRINEDEAAVVRRIFYWYVKEGEGCLSISKRLNESGLRTKRGCLWSQNAISRIIKNPLYIGKVINGKEETREIYSSKRNTRPPEDWYVIENEALKLIEEDVFSEAQDILSGRKEAFHMSGIRHSNRYAFSTLIRCRCCGRSFRRVEKNAQGVCAKWVCSSRNGDGIEACRNAVRIEEEELMGGICSYLRSYLADKENIKSEAKKRYQEQWQELQNRSDSSREVKRQLQDCKGKQKKLQDMYLNDLITMEELKEQSAPLKNKEAKYKEKLRQMEKKKYTQEQLDKTLEELFEDIEQLLNADTVTNEMLRKIVDRIEVDENGAVEVGLKKLEKK